MSNSNSQNHSHVSLWQPINSGFLYLKAILLIIIVFKCSVDITFFLSRYSYSVVMLMLSVDIVSVVYSGISIFILSARTQQVIAVLIRANIYKFSNISLDFWHCIDFKNAYILLSNFLCEYKYIFWALDMLVLLMISIPSMHYKNIMKIQYIFRRLAWLSCDLVIAMCRHCQVI